MWRSALSWWARIADSKPPFGVVTFLNASGIANSETTAVMTDSYTEGLCGVCEPRLPCWQLRGKLCKLQVVSFVEPVNERAFVPRIVRPRARQLQDVMMRLFVGITVDIYYKLLCPVRRCLEMFAFVWTSWWYCVDPTCLQIFYFALAPQIRSTLYHSDWMGLQNQSTGSSLWVFLLKTTECIPNTIGHLLVAMHYVGAPTLKLWTKKTVRDRIASSTASTALCREEWKIAPWPCCCRYGTKFLWDTIV